MSLRFKCEADGNSGLYFHTDFTPGTVGRLEGHAVRNRSHAEPSHRRPLRRRPQLDRVARARVRAGDPADRLERAAASRSKGNHMVAVLNGVEVLNFTDPTPKSFDGFIALQLHSGGLGNMRFKDIYVRDLSSRARSSGSGLSQSLKISRRCREAACARARGCRQDAVSPLWSGTPGTRHPIPSTSLQSLPKRRRSRWRSRKSRVKASSRVNAFSPEPADKSPNMLG